MGTERQKDFRTVALVQQVCLWFRVWWKVERELDGASAVLFTSELERI
jgi:hypothetical protein